MGNALIQDLRTHEDAKATLKQMIMNTDMLPHRDTYLFRYTFGNNKVQIQFKKIITSQVKPTILV